ncbi:TetR/AcrR family transcriptional regulator [cf. Phormidesmis sp. LEGE 11477]|uniref:TetR/AcrR family transcriptional regulator n=1 Tax=cf. Phormidesmis sp. LEGE 11477 TaxID=1828680 RepID=UPI00188084E4|nr:TetR/AcrR family transcriptional regulator [cf. Phormidesmis sp. LEGE 11477]MBE9060287.1 TetR/AcrR family transcriptional regulator [cf. Phormidesmis sp. LEGE 11477]
MTRGKTVTDEEILAAAQSLFLEVGIKASTKKIAQNAGISEAVIFQRFKTKEDLFFSAMVPPAARLEEIFRVQSGEKTVSENLELISLKIVDYFREVMPTFIALVGHPAFNMQTFLQRHTMPRIQIGNRLTEYLHAEAEIGRIRRSQVEIAVAVLLSYLHHLAMAETIGAHKESTQGTISDAIEALWQGLCP